MPLWSLLKRAAPPAPASEEMDWQPQTPQQSSEEPIYPDQYVPGGWPNTLATPRFPRVADPDAWVPKAKRVCRGIGRAGALTANATIKVGTTTARIGARGVAHTATFAGNSTISVVRKLNRRRPREPRPRSRAGAPFERTLGYSSPRFSHIRIRDGPPSFAQEEEDRARKAMEFVARFPPRKREPPVRMSKPWVNTYQNTDLVLMPFDNPMESSVRDSNANLQKTQETTLPQPEQMTSQLKLPARPRYHIGRKMRGKKQNYSALIFKPKLANSSNSLKYALEQATDHVDSADNHITDPTPKVKVSPSLAGSPVTPLPKIGQKWHGSIKNPFLDIFNSPSTPSTVPTVRSNKTPQTASRTVDTSYLHDTPSRILSQKSSPEQKDAEVITSGTERQSKSPERTEQDSTDAKPAEEPRKSHAAEEQDNFDVERSEQPIKSIENQEQQILDTKPTEVSSKSAEITEQHGLAEHTEVPRTPQPVSIQDLVADPELPSRSESPESDISSTCDVTPLPNYGQRVLPADDAVGLSPSPSPKVAQTAPPSRILPSVVGSIPGAWVDETTVGSKDTEKVQSQTDTIARRTRSMQVRFKEEQPRTPQAKKTLVDHTPPKTPKHGSTKSKVANEIQEKRIRLRRSAEQWKITSLSSEWVEKVEQAVKVGDPRSGLKGSDLARVAPFRTHGANRDNWLNDEAINEYLNIVSAHGQGETDEKAPRTHHAFSTFFYSTLLDKSKGTKALRRWSKRAGIDGKKLLSTKFVFIPINSGAHWTLCVVSGANKTVTYYDSMNGNGSKKMRDVLEWVAAELEEEFVRDEWTLLAGMSGQQTNSDDCGVFTVTNARSLMLGEEPDKAFSAHQMRFQRERIVAEIINGGLLARGA